MKDQKFYQAETPTRDVSPSSSPERRQVYIHSIRQEGEKLEGIKREQLAVGSYEYETEEPEAKRLCMGSYN